jgi:hypothetical protein
MSMVCLDNPLGWGQFPGLAMPFFECSEHDGAGSCFGHGFGGGASPGGGDPEYEGDGAGAAVGYGSVHGCGYGV